MIAAPTLHVSKHFHRHHYRRVNDQHCDCHTLSRGTNTLPAYQDIHPPLSRPSTASNCCNWGGEEGQGPQAVCFRFFEQKVAGYGFSSGFSKSSPIIAFVATRLCRSAIHTTAQCGVRYVACHVQVALLMSFLGPPRYPSGVPVVALLVVLQQWLLVASVCCTFLVG